MTDIKQISKQISKVILFHMSNAHAYNNESGLKITLRYHRINTREMLETKEK